MKPELNGLLIMDHATGKHVFRTITDGEVRDYKIAAESLRVTITSDNLELSDGKLDYSEKYRRVKAGTYYFVRHWIAAGGPSCPPDDGGIVSYHKTREEAEAASLALEKRHGTGYGLTEWGEVEDPFFTTEPESHLGELKEEY